ncbi:MAG TPA: TonB-dependent receptor [Kiritimatiellia bacterium]|nr:TonB-dependent receptor [Kiritimatiellia bacterium]HMO99412.1 TonB-dependent receptor [Kiritimatiellia bacterium]HMP96825.1 TonB-dependent receptor [Kiritimatiellia bacterium]
MNLHAHGTPSWEKAKRSAAGFVIAISFILPHLSAHAASAGFPRYEFDDLYEMSLEELMNVPIRSGSHSPMILRDIPVTMRIIGRDELLAIPYRGLAGALKYEPGFRVSQPGSGWQGDLFLMRGLLGNYYTKILLDGLPITPSVVSGAPLGEQLYIRNLERVEILYGPASALYGADAVAGVINLISREPEHFEAHAGAFAGEFGYQRYHVELYVPVAVWDGENLFLDLYGVYVRRDDTHIKNGHEAVFARETYHARAGEVNRVPFALGDLPGENWGTGLKLRYRDWRLSYDRMYRADHSSLGQHTEYYLYDDPDAKLGETIDRLSLRHEKEFGTITLKTRLSYLRYRLDPDSYFSFIFPLNDPGRFGERNNNYKYQASDDFLWEETTWIPLSDAWTLAAGFSLQHSSVLPKSNDLEMPFHKRDYRPFRRSRWEPDSIYGTFGQNEHTFRQLGLFAEGLYRSDAFDVQVGSRYDQNSRYEDVWTHRIAGQLKLSPETSLRSSYGQAYKAPAGYYSYNAVATLEADGAIRYHTIPNPDLGPEKSDSVEIGIRHWFTKNIIADIAFYHTEVRGLIGRGPIAVDPGLYPNAANTESRTSINRSGDSTRIQGMQAALTLQNALGIDGFDSTVSLDYITGKESLADGKGTVDGILMSPEWMLKWRLALRPLPRLQLFIDQMICSSWKSRNVSTPDDYYDRFNHVDGYYLMDLGGTYAIGKHWTAYLRLENVWDEKYGGIDAYDNNILQYNPQTGRMLMAGLEVRF